MPESYYPIPGDCQCWNCQNLLLQWIDLGVDICATLDIREHEGTTPEEFEGDLRSWFESANELIGGKVRERVTAT